MSYVDDNRYWQRWTITINGRTKEAVRNAMKKVTCNSFQILRMDDIFSTSSGSTKIEDRKEGDKMSPYEPEVKGYSPMDTAVGYESVGYELETVYEACVEIEHIIHKICFMFSRRTGTSVVSIRHADISGGDWVNYNLAEVDVQFFVPRGTWILHTAPGRHPTWLFMSKQDGLTHSSTITKAWTGVDSAAQKAYREVQDRARGLRGKHYDKVIVDNMIEEVKSKMLQLIDVIFFNRKTKTVDYRKEIVAVDMEEAYMLAAQEYGKYNSKVHMRHANCLFSFAEDGNE